ncbi:hypothetical protein ACOJIV_27270, partial [Haloarcula sp. AONF1]
VTTFDNLLEIGNQGSQDVEVTISGLSSYSDYITVDDDNDNDFTSGVTIEEGTSNNVNVEVNLEGFTGSQSASPTVTFTASAVDSSS